MRQRGRRSGVTARSCPSCGLDVASHQTLCPSCRTPVPSEAGPVAPSAEGTGIVVTAPPPRRGGVASDAPPAESDLDLPPAVPEVGAAPDIELAPASPFAPPTYGAAPDAGPVPPPPTPIPPPPPAVPPPPPPVAFPPPLPPPVPPRPAPPAREQVTSAPAASAGTLGVPGAAVLDERSNLPGGLVALLGAVLVVVGVFLPWMEVGDETVSGWRSSDDAKVLLVLAAAVTVAAALIIGGARSLVLRIGLAVVGLATVVVGLVDVVSVGDQPGDVSHGPGLVVVLVGGVLVVLAALLTRHRRFR